MQDLGFNLAKFSGTVFYPSYNVYKRDTVSIRGHLVSTGTTKLRPSLKTYLIQVVQNTTHLSFSLLVILASVTFLPSSKSNLSRKGSMSNSWFEVSLCSYTLYLPQCDVGKNLVSFYSSNKQGSFQVHDTAVCMFCLPHLVKLNKLFQKLLFLV